MVYGSILGPAMWPRHAPAPNRSIPACWPEQIREICLESRKISSFSGVATNKRKVTGGKAIDERSDIDHAGVSGCVLSRFGNWRVRTIFSKSATSPPIIGACTLFTELPSSNTLSCHERTDACCLFKALTEDSVLRFTLRRMLSESAFMRHSTFTT